MFMNLYGFAAYLPVTIPVAVIFPALPSVRPELFLRDTGLANVAGYADNEQRLAV